MVIDKIKFSIYLKSFFVLSYILYAIFYSRVSYEVIINENMSQKDFLFEGGCLSILGGSNAIWGISSEQLNTQHCGVKNYGIIREGGSFENYTKWLSKDIKSRSVIYSSYLFLADNYPDIYQDERLFPETPIINRIKKILLPMPKAPEAPNFEYNFFGDLVNYDCKSSLSSFKFESKNFSNINELVAIEVASRLKLIGEITEAKEILVRIPPVYVDDKNLENYKSLMKKRVEIFSKMGINVVETSIASNDRSLFCDVAHHPNAKGRYFFTNELKEKLKIH